MRRRLRRALSTVAVLALATGSLLVASPALADAPLVTITSPAVDSRHADGPVTVAGEIDASVDHAIMYDGSTPIMTLLPGSYAFPWTFAPGGDHYLTLSAFDSGDALLEQATRHFEAGVPQVTITSPVATGGTYHVNQYSTISFDATLDDPDGIPFWIASATDIATNVQTSLLGAGIGGGPYSSAHMSVDTEYLPVGSYRLGIAVHDSTGVGGYAEFTLVVDSPSLPGITFNSPATAAVYGPNDTVPLDATITPYTASAEWTLELDDVEIGSGSGLSVSASVLTTELPEGVHTFRVSAIDEDGRPNSATQTFAVDRTGPTIVVLGPSNLSYVNPLTTPSLGYGATFDTGSLVNFFVDSAWVWQELDDDGTFGWGIDTSTWANESGHLLRIEASDEHGNQSHVDTIVIADTQAPYSVTLADPAPNTTIGARAYASGFAGDHESQVTDVRVDVFKVNATTGNCNVNSLGHQDFTPVAGWWDGYLDLSALPSGKYCFQATGTDQAGNATSSPKMTPITVDTKAPAVPTVVSPVDGSVVRDLALFDWTNSSDANGPVTYEFQLADGPDVAASPTQSNPGLTASKITVSSGYHAGDWYWHVRAVDALGNTSAWSPTYHVTTVGVPEITSPCGCELYGAGQDVDVTFTGGGLDWLYVDHYVVKFTDEDGDTFTRIVDPADLQWVGPFPGWADDGEWTIRVRAIFTTDIEGSLFGVWSDPVTVRYDGTAPVAPTLISPVADLVTNDTDITIEWQTTDTDIAQFLLHWNKTGNASHGILGGTHVIPVGTGTSYDLSGLNDGEYYWQLVAIDEAGNASISEIRHGTIDTTAPAGVTLVSLADGSTTTSSTVTFTWQAADPAEGVVGYEFDANTTLAALNAGGTPSFQAGTSFTPPVAVTNGTYFWHVRAVDAAGNSGPWSDAWSVTVAVVAPPATPHHTTTSSTGSGGEGDDAAEPTPSATPTAEPTDEPSAEPSAEPTDDSSASPTDDPEATNASDTGFPVIWLIVIIVAVLAGGGFLIRFLVIRRA